MYEDVTVSENAGLANMLFETVIFFLLLVSSCQAGPKVVCIVSFMGRTMSVNLLMRQFRPTRGSAVQPKYRTPFGFSEI